MIFRYSRWLQKHGPKIGLLCAGLGTVLFYFSDRLLLHRILLLWIGVSWLIWGIARKISHYKEVRRYKMMMSRMKRIGKELQRCAGEVGIFWDDKTLHD